MGRAPCCDKANVKKGPWSPEEDAKLKEFIDKFGTGGNWIALPQKAGLKRCGKSCRLRWLNYLRPNIKHGEFSDEEDRVICTLYATIGSRWSIIAAQLPGRTDNDIKNYWNTKLKKKLMGSASGIHPGLQGKFSSLHPFSGSNSTLQTPHYFSSSSSSLQQYLYNSIYTPSSGKFPISPQQNFLYNPNPDSGIPYMSSSSGQYSLTQEGGLLDLPYFKDNNNMLIFGGNDQPASSSSDGSCSQISYGGKDHHHVIKQEAVPAAGFVASEDQSHNKFMIQGHVDPIASFILDQKPNVNGVLENNGQLQLQYELEEVKQLITYGGDINSLLFNEEDKMTDHHQIQSQRGMYYF